MSTDPPSTALAAIARRRYPLTRWPWRSLGYLLTGAPVAVATGLGLAVAVLPLAVLVVRLSAGDTGFAGVLVVLSGLGIAALAALGPLVAVPLAELERARLRFVDDRAAVSAHRPPPSPGLWAWLRTRYTEPATWHELGYAGLLGTVVPVAYVALGLAVALIVAGATSPLAVAAGGEVTFGLGPISTPEQALPYAIAGLVLLPAVPYLVGAVAGAHGALAWALLTGGAGERLRAELVEVSRSRARLVDAFEAERRRIERDLHDGAQQRLVGLALQLGMARLNLPSGTDAADSVARAHDQAKQLMAELRELIHDIHPQVLTDFGLPAALAELADRAAVPVTVDARLPGRAPRHVEAMAYFVVAEALTNVAKHSGATSATVTVRRPADALVVEVCDDGSGGADPARGTGLTGLADRVAVLGGRVLVSSPSGGPTVLRAELPCPPG